MNLVEILSKWGIEAGLLQNTIIIGFQIISMALIGWLTYYITKVWISKIIIKIASKTKGELDDMLFNKTFFKRLGMLLVPIVIQFTSSKLGWEYAKIINQVLSIWITLTSVMFISSILDLVTAGYEKFSKSKSQPVRIIIQVVNVFMYCIVAIIIISIILDKDPKTLIMGLSAFAAVLMLVFKDSILGLTAGIQLSANNMIKIGDWIEMPSAKADGDVIQISLTTVKVQNWDKTITTIPTYKLVSESFINWRGMAESKGRRIKRSVNIDVHSIRHLSAEDLEQLGKSKLLKEYIDKKVKELNEFNANRSAGIDERRLTNIGTFREYLEQWLSNHPEINLNMTHMVRQLQPGPTGLPLEVYCFSANQVWVQYERIQSDIFDHIFAVLPLFHLRAFEYGSVAEA